MIKINPNKKIRKRHRNRIKDPCINCGGKCYPGYSSTLIEDKHFYSCSLCGNLFSIFVKDFTLILSMVSQ